MKVSIGTCNHLGKPHFWVRRAGNRSVYRRRIERPNDPTAMEQQRVDLLVEFSTERTTRAAKKKAKPLTGDDSHLAEYLRFLKAETGNEMYVDQTRHRIVRTFTAAGITKFNEINVSKIVTAVAELHCLPPKKPTKKVLPQHINMRPLSEQSRNHYYQSLKQFCKWLSEEQGLGPHPLAKLKAKRKVSVKPCKRDRMQPDELVRLIATAEKSTVEIDAVDGQTRAIIYRLAVFTGFRRAELASLRPSSFSLDSDPPTIRVASAYTKNGDEAVLPLNQTLVPIMRGWLSNVEGDSHLFPGLETKKTYKMVQTDLKAAKLPIRTADGTRNLHCLRNTYISMLLESGADAKVAQLLARHSDINLTLAYARPVRGGDVVAINRLRLPG